MRRYLGTISTYLFAQKYFEKVAFVSGIDRLSQVNTIDRTGKDNIRNSITLGMSTLMTL